MCWVTLVMAHVQGLSVAYCSEETPLAMLYAGAERISAVLRDRV